MHVYLIRHAQSENNALSAETIHKRKVDPKLTELGYRQREALASYIAQARDNGEGFDIMRIYTSAMHRSLLTAQPLAAALGLQPRVWLDLHEKGGLFARHNGHVQGYGGMTRSDITRDFPGYALPDSLGESGWYETALGFEPETHSFYRAIKVAQELRDWNQGEAVIALVSHAGFLDILLKAIFEQLPSRPYSMRYYHNNTGITRVDYHQGEPALHYLNRVPHLKAAMRSY